MKHFAEHNAQFTSQKSILPLLTEVRTLGIKIMNLDDTRKRG